MTTTSAAALALALAPAAFAQDEATRVEEVVVTGSRIPQPNLTSISPVTTVSNQEIMITGTTRVEDLVNSLPQAFAGQGSMLSNGATGEATVDLRHLGPERTLVLINGRRLMPGGPAYSSNQPTADLNFIPAALIDRVEVLTGGASAVYGSDAVAGVVNFIMKKNMTGLQIDAQASTYQHDNDDEYVQGLNAARGFTAPSGSRWDGQTYDLTISGGLNTPDAKGNVTGYFGYREIQAVAQSSRDFSNCALSETATAFRCAGSGTAATGQIYVFDADFNQIGDSLTITPGGGVRTFTSADQFNYAPYNYYQRPDERYTAGLFAHYEVDEDLDLYAEYMFMDDKTVAQIAPSGLFGETYNISCSSPMFSAAQVQAFCTDAGFGPDDTTNIAILRRNVEGGARQDYIHHRDNRAVLGAKGAFSDTWAFDTYLSYGKVDFDEEYRNDISSSRVTQALNGCPAGSDPGCAPYNIFTDTPSQEALDFITVTATQEGYTTESVGHFDSTGKLIDYGLKTPWATDGLTVNLGVEYRRETIKLDVDEVYASGELNGQGGPRTDLDGEYDVWELIGELNVPLVQDAALAKDLLLNLGYRYSEYSTVGPTRTYKVGLDWRPVDAIRFRVGFNRAARAPNILELYEQQAVNLDGNTDPCAGSDPDPTFEQCARTGVTAAQYGNIAANSANQYNGLQGGNPDLEAETADTKSIGVVFTPPFLPGFSASIDYYDIKVEDVIDQIGADLILTQCINTGDPYYCNLIHRASGSGSLWLGDDGYVINTNINAGSRLTSGIDFAADYRMPVSNGGGTVLFSFVGTWVEKYETQPLPDSESYDCAGYYGPTCDTPLPKWRSKLRVTWQSPWNVNLSAAWRYIDSVKVEASSESDYLSGTVYPADAKLRAMNYIDLAADFTVRQNYTLRFGVNNVFDKDPPLVGSTYLSQVWGSGNTYPQIYDTLGRYIFSSITAKF